MLPLSGVSVPHSLPVISIVVSSFDNEDDDTTDDDNVVDDNADYGAIQLNSLE